MLLETWNPKCINYLKLGRQLILTLSFFLKVFRPDGRIVKFKEKIKAYYEKNEEKVAEYSVLINLKSTI